VSMSPSILPAVVEATQSVRDPASGQSVYERWKQRRAEASIRSYAVESESGKNSGSVPFGILGGGSDFMVFLQHNGVPSVDMIFDGPYGVYHSVYDDFDWMKRYGDPGFHYHAAMSRIWGLLALRFANADLLPFDYSVYAREVAAYLEGLKKIAPADFFESDIRPLIEKSEAWRRAAVKSTEALESWRGGDPAPAPSAAAHLSEINAQLMGEERALLNDEGLPGRPWFRHLIYAPLPSYDAETLPGLREMLEAKDMEGAGKQAKRIGEALDKAREALGAP